MNAPNKTNMTSRIPRAKIKSSHEGQRKWLLATSLLAAASLIVASYIPDASAAPEQPISSREAFLRAQRATRHSSRSTPSTSTSTTTTTTGTPPPPSTSSIPQASSTSAPKSPSSTSTTTSTTTTPPPKHSHGPIATISNQAQQVPNNRSTRTADVFQSGEGYNLLVTNTCEREMMRINIKTSKPFFGLIHTRDQRKKAVCRVEASGETEFNLDISHVLNTQDPEYCGVVRSKKESPDDKDLLQVVVAVRFHRSIELPDDKYFLLNCTNRCRKADCSNESNARLQNLPESESESPEVVTPESEGTANREKQAGKAGGGDEECTIWKFPWVITLLWCMGILLLAMIISHCIMCSSLVCRCVKTEVEETEPSVYEGASDVDDDGSIYRKRNHPMRIDYDNKNIYKTSNNYEPYTMDDCIRDHDDDLHDGRKRKSHSRRH